MAESTTPDTAATVIQGVDPDEDDDIDRSERASVLRGSGETAPLEDDKSPSEVYGDGQPDAIEGSLSPEAQVVLYHKADLKPEEIAADMATVDPTMDVAKVRRIIRQYKQNPSSIVLPKDAVV